jgi:hypothetical protein
MVMHWAQWSWLTRAGERIDVPELYRRCARLIEAGEPRDPGFTYSGTLAALVMYGDADYRRAPALWVPMTPFWDRHDAAWDPARTAAAFRDIADQLDAEVPPTRRRRG